MEYKVSIIVPIYNVEAYIQSCLESVAKQTMSEKMECILVDDCGKDNSMQMAKQFVKEYRGNISFTILHHKHNRGLSAARNTGINAAKGEYIFFLDSDDEITPTCIQAMYLLAIKYGRVDLVQGTYLKTPIYMRQSSEPPFPEFTDNRRFIKTNLLNYFVIPVMAQNRLYRRDFILKHNLFFKVGIIHEDNHFMFFLAKHVKSMVYCKERTYNHRYNPNSISRKINIPKATAAYRVIIEDFSSNIDSYLIGHQKDFALTHVLVALSAHFYENQTAKQHLINTFAKHNTPFERVLLKLYFNLKNEFVKTKILHLLIRTYKLKD